MLKRGTGNVYCIYLLYLFCTMHLHKEYHNFMHAISDAALKKIWIYFLLISVSVASLKTNTLHVQRVCKD